MLRILLTGGGSGGHVYPLIAVAEELQKQAAQNGVPLELRFLGADGLIKDVAATIGVTAIGVISPKWRRYLSYQNFTDILKAPFGFLQALFYVWRFMPDLIFSKGGYDSFLPALIARILAIPVIIHESDVVPGKANLWVGKWAKKIFLTFDGAKGYFRQDLVEAVGNPIRTGITNITDKAAALAAFNLNSSKPVVLITGASQGAQVINEVLLLSLVELTKKFQIIHQCGPNNYDSTNAQILTIVKEGEGTYGKTIADSYRLYPSFDLRQMALAYSAADIIVGRSGAGTIFEMAAVGKPAIIIPLKGAASDHQLANAREFAKFGAIVIEEENLTPHILISEIESVYENRSELSAKIKQFARPSAASIIAEELLNFIANGR
ncbi:MAG: UDP-N-acetylglucosamine--N-acetylmuramyl-(pentapeptide) pyrophosphoryl-undecaprenol N-acetylglucosamine transferase [Candidatus Yanofskybacteria bacterium]|nr:UDP-N-acetylglucosamine--N-acetylmuramyl-(pentapeptide) pyrophosphoryl-undecaprenol N-acetylglucosamine transferase [Candidatus Yanofskybacteria bacterium]